MIDIRAARNAPEAWRVALARKGQRRSSTVCWGFRPGVMPQNYGQSLTPEQIAVLVAALLPQG